MEMNRGIFTISLDFELHWGVSDTKTVDDYRKNLDNTRAGIYGMLEIFQHFEIHATWATVGFLFCKDKVAILSEIDKLQKPTYENSLLSNYRLLDQIGNNHEDDPYHYGLDMLERIRKTPHQEIGTHTFSHYYTLEKGQTVEQFEDDLVAAISAAAKLDIELRSIVFPRNQYDQDYLIACSKNNITVYRGNSDHWIYRPVNAKGQHLLRRGARLLDAYINLAGSNSYILKDQTTKPFNVPASRFLRPVSETFSFLESVRLKRIKKEMTFAAKNKRLYHLWWHPHNFGNNVQKNLDFLNEILVHYKTLNKQYQFQSLNMLEVASLTK